MGGGEGEGEGCDRRGEGRKLGEVRDERDESDEG